MIIMNEDQVHMKPSTESKIKKVREYIDTHFANNMLSIPLLAEEAEISEVYLRKLFKQQYHIRPRIQLMCIGYTFKLTSHIPVA